MVSQDVASFAMPAVSLDFCIEWLTWKVGRMVRVTCCDAVVIQVSAVVIDSLAGFFFCFKPLSGLCSLC